MEWFSENMDRNKIGHDIHFQREMISTLRFELRVR